MKKVHKMKRFIKSHKQERLCKPGESETFAENLTHIWARVTCARCKAMRPLKISRKNK